MARGTCRRLAARLVWAAILAPTSWARAEVVVQFPVDGGLDGRPVATLTGGTARVRASQDHLVKMLARWAVVAMPLGPCRTWVPQLVSMVPCQSSDMSR